jgi:hypothetical protein
VGGKTKYGVMPNLHVLDVWPTQIGTNSTLLVAFILEDGGFKVARFDFGLARRSKFKAPNVSRWEGCPLESTFRAPLSVHDTCPFVQNSDCG